MFRNEKVLPDQSFLVLLLVSLIILLAFVFIWDVTRVDAMEDKPVPEYVPSPGAAPSYEGSQSEEVLGIPWNFTICYWVDANGIFVPPWYYGAIKKCYYALALTLIGHTVTPSQLYSGFGGPCWYLSPDCIPSP